MARNSLIQSKDDRGASPGKLFSLKEWLTVPETAKHLSILFGEDVTEADVLRLALDGRLRLSLNIVNPILAKKGITVLASTVLMTPELEYRKEVLGDRFSEALVFVPEDNDIIEIDGVFDFDLRRTGGIKSRVFVEHQHLTCGPMPRGRLSSQRWDEEYELGVVAEADDGQLFQLQQRHVCGLFGTILGLLKYQRWFDYRAVLITPLSWLPRDDTRLIIRTGTLREFEATLNGPSATNEKPIATTERNTLLSIIAALCDYSAINHQERGAASQIAKLTEEIGAVVTDDTVRKVLAKIPDALETRMK
jgi:hypothetical protein